MHIIRDLHFTLHWRIARCPTLSLSRCSWRCHKKQVGVFSLCYAFICFCNHSSRSRTERDEFVFGCLYRSTAWESLRSFSTWEFYHDLTHRRLSKLPTTACWFRRNVGKDSKMCVVRWREPLNCEMKGLVVLSHIRVLRPWRPIIDRWVMLFVRQCVHWGKRIENMLIDRRSELGKWIHLETLTYMAKSTAPRNRLYVRSW